MSALPERMRERRIITRSDHAPSNTERVNRWPYGTYRQRRVIEDCPQPEYPLREPAARVAPVRIDAMPHAAPSGEQADGNHLEISK